MIQCYEIYFTIKLNYNSMQDIPTQKKIKRSDGDLKLLIVN